MMRQKINRFFEISLYSGRSSRAVGVLLTFIYRRAVGAYSNAYYGPGTGDILLDNVVCDNNRLTTLYSCDHRGWSVHDCTHKEDVGVVCSKYMYMQCRRGLQ